jgi:hypothetical protein
MLIVAAVLSLAPLIAPTPSQAADAAPVTVSIQKASSGGVRFTTAAPCGISSYVLTRQTACSFEGPYDLQLISEGVVVARLPFTVMSEVTVSGLTGHWKHVVSLIAGQASGNMSGTTAWGSAHCDQNCSGGGLHSSSGFDTGSIVTWTHEFTSEYHGNTSWPSRSGWDIWFVTRATNPVSPSVTITPPPSHRCDDLLGPPWGCTFPQVTPVVAVRNTAPTYYRFFNLALNFGGPRTLTRTTSSAVGLANIARACPGPDAAHAWPAGYTCEAYPFNSTYEGAAAQSIGRTFLVTGGLNGGGVPIFCRIPWLPIQNAQVLGGFSACMIPNAESSAVTSALFDFYFFNRVIDGDRFGVTPG